MSYLGDIMATEKRMDESEFAKIVKELAACGELIRTHQDEKQAALNEFDKELERFKSGKLSQKALASSVRKVNSELSKLDRNLRNDIRRVASVSNRARAMANRQAPRHIRVSMKA
jgi:hypothetical protein